MGHPPLMGRVVTEAPKHCVVPVLGWARLGPLKLEKCRGWGEVVRMGEERGCDSGETLVSQETFPDTPLCAPPLILFHPLTALIKIITTQLVALICIFHAPTHRRRDCVCLLTFECSHSPRCAPGTGYLGERTHECLNRFLPGEGGF